MWLKSGPRLLLGGGHLRSRATPPRPSRLVSEGFCASGALHVSGPFVMASTSRRTCRDVSEPWLWLERESKTQRDFLRHLQGEALTKIVRVLGYSLMIRFFETLLLPGTGDIGGLSECHVPRRLTMR